MKCFAEIRKLWEEIKSTPEFKLNELCVNITEQIYSLMLQKGYDNEEMSRRLGIKQGLFEWQMEYPDLMTLKDLYRIAEVLDCNLEVSFHEL